MRTRLGPFAALLLVGCPGGAIPEGFYPCHTGSECPTNWYCRADLHCWSTMDPPDAATDAEARDAGQLDAGCAVEACNGADDDCDGLIDEGVVTVGVAVTALPSTTLSGGRLVPIANGFALFASGASSGDATWVALAADGTASGAPSMSSYQLFTDAVGSGPLALVGTAGAAGTGLAVVDVSASDPQSTFPFDHSGLVGLARVGDFDGRYATVYVNYLGTSYSIWRLRLDFRTDPAVLLSETMMTDQVEEAAFSVLHTAEADYLAYLATGGDVAIGAAPTDDHTGAFRDIGPIVTNQPQVTVALAIRDPAAPVSEANPIAAAWARSSDVSFAEITATSTLASTPVRSFPGAPGSVDIALTALPAPTGSPAHWIAAVTNDRAQVFEITAASIREVPLVDEATADRPTLSFARSLGVLRVAEAGNAGGVVTRSIGCE